MIVEDLKTQATVEEIREACEAFKLFHTQFFAGMITLEAAYVAGYLKLKEKKEVKAKELEDLI